MEKACELIDVGLLLALPVIHDLLLVLHRGLDRSLAEHACHDIENCKGREGNVQHEQGNHKRVDVCEGINRLVPIHPASDRLEECVDRSADRAESPLEQIIYTRTPNGGDGRILAPAFLAEAGYCLSEQDGEHVDHQQKQQHRPEQGPQRTEHAEDKQPQWPEEAHDSDDPEDPEYPCDAKDSHVRQVARRPGATEVLHRAGKHAEGNLGQGDPHDESVEHVPSSVLCLKELRPVGHDPKHQLGQEKQSVHPGDAREDHQGLPVVQVGCAVLRIDPNVHRVAHDEGAGEQLEPPGGHQVLDARPGMLPTRGRLFRHDLGANRHPHTLSLFLRPVP
mmetsp:Transcript_94276/g.236643  ORF Transcript_94276/g.236643 Transcript_94276/m.236643 type:complete len:335 (-) Transcript_94276:433-1437(-)